MPLTTIRLRSALATASAATSFDAGDNANSVAAVIVVVNATADNADTTAAAAVVVATENYFTIVEVF